jgi:hypothetical protein
MVGTRDKSEPFTATGRRRLPLCEKRKIKRSRQRLRLKFAKLRKGYGSNTRGRLACKARPSLSRRMDPTIMKTIFRFGLPSQAARLLLLLCYLAVSDRQAAGALALPPEGSAAEAILSEARLSLAEARKTHSDPRAALGWYLQAAERALRAASKSSSNQASEARRFSELIDQLQHAQVIECRFSAASR